MEVVCECNNRPRVRRSTVIEIVDYNWQYYYVSVILRENVTMDQYSFVQAAISLTSIHRDWVIVDKDYVLHINCIDSVIHCTSKFMPVTQFSVFNF